MRNNDTAFFGHPRGLSPLFFTEMWERFSYYGIRALLILYMTAPVDKLGLGLDVPTAGAIYGLFTSCAYLFALPGGWIADRFTGQHQAILLGGFIIALGNFGMLVKSTGVLVLSLLAIAIGTGLLKTATATTVGFLYPPGDARRDAGFSIYYIGINLGAGIAPLICGWVGQRVDYRAAFALAGVFMLAGLVQFYFTKRQLGDAGRVPVVTATPGDRKLLLGGIGAVVAAVLIGAALQAPLTQVADAFALLLLVAVVVTFAALLLSKDFTPVEKKRIQAVLVLFVASAVFWSIFEQAGSTLNLFADRSTRNEIFGFEYPSSWFQSVNSVCLWLMAPLLAALWVKLGDRNPSVMVKFAAGLFGAGAGFLIMMLAAQAAGGNTKVSPLWLLACYFVHTAGELCLSPVGLSAMTKLAPARIAGFTMGVFFLSISVGNFLGGRLSSFYEAMPLDHLFGYVGLFGVAMGMLMLLLAKPVVRLMGGVK